jgi:hypothetical protein
MKTRLRESGGQHIRYRKCGIRLAARYRCGTLRESPSDLAPRGSEAAMIRVVLPAHLRTLAQAAGEVTLDGAGHGAFGPRRA